MKKFSLKKARHLLKNSFYLKMLILYSVFTFAVITFSTLYLTNYLNDKLEKEIYKSNKRLLTQVQIFSDTNLVEKVKSLVVEKCINFPNNKAVWDFYNNAGPGKVEPLLRLKETALDIIINSNYDFIDSIYFYRKSDDTVVSSREGISSNILSPDNINRRYINIDAIKRAMISPEGQSWIAPLENKAFWKDSLVISLCQSIPAAASPEARKGCVIININQKVFFKSINKVYDTNTGELMIVDSNGRLFAHSSWPVTNEAVIRAGSYIKSFLNKDDGFILSTSNGKSICISWIKSSLSDWRYISIIPVETLNKELFIARQYTLVFIGIIILFSFISLNLITLLIYKPVKALVKKIKDSAGINQDSVGEFKLISNIITNLSSRVADMESTITENKSLIEYKLAVDILQSNIKNENELNTRLKLIGKTFRFKYYGIVLIEINSRIYGGIPADQREFVIYKVIDVANGYLSREFDCINICYMANVITTIINFKDYTVLLNNLKSLISLLESELELNYNMAVSEPIDNILLLGSLYTQTNNFLKYSFIYGYGNIFDYNKINKYEKSSGDFEINILNNFEAQLKTCKINSIKDEISKFITVVGFKGLSYSYVQDILIQIVNIICKVSREQTADTNGLDKSQVISHFNDISSLEDCAQWFYSLLDQYTENINTRNSHANQELISAINEYACHNIDKQISLYIIADKFNLTPNYISRIYKEITGINFSDFILDKKFEKAAELLISEKKASVSYVAERLGYLNLPYFSKLFKEKYGMTPIQYRKKYSCL
jgi:AraC-type DNA-binding domain-containing proteins